MSGLAVRYDLTEQQAKFVDALLSGFGFADAAASAGYASREYGSTLAKLPHVAAAINEEISRRLVTEIAPLAFHVAREIIKDPKSGARVRADLSIKLLGMAGHGVKEGQKDRYDKPLSELTSAELGDLIQRNTVEIDRLEREAASRAKDVSAPGATTIDAKALGYLD